VVMEKGRVVDRGPHMELLERNAFYSSIYRHQTNSYAEGGVTGGEQ
jgi:ABC-type multidrug transport system fused ATPase/permease subunit